MNTKERKRLRRLQAAHDRQIKQLTRELAARNALIQEQRDSDKRAFAWLTVRRQYESASPMLMCTVRVSPEHLELLNGDLASYTESLASQLLEGFKRKGARA